MICAAIVKIAKNVRGTPEWEEEVVERINLQVESIEKEATTTRRWGTSKSGVGRSNRPKSEECAEDRRTFVDGRRRNVQVRTLKVQSQTNGLSGTFVVLTEREQGAHEEQLEERMTRISEKGKKARVFWQHFLRFHQEKSNGKGGILLNDQKSLNVEC